MSRTLKLGLIGDNIDRSQSPRLHRACGQMAGIEVEYQRLIPPLLHQSFEEVFATARDAGFDGVNVTYPYKARVAELVRIDDPTIRAMRAVNTVLFSGSDPRGFNTDYSGFIGAYRAARRHSAPGTVCLIGAGGVGKAIAFALLTLKARALICVDMDREKAQDLADALIATRTRTEIRVADGAVAAAHEADGIINCTPLGMVNIGGTPLPFAAMAGAEWAFDAVYTPVETTFLQDARKAGLSVISGYELFIEQGLDAWSLFSGSAVDRGSLRAELARESA